MSREIKFRIWKKSIKKYIDLTTFTITNNGEITAVVDSNILEPALNKDDYILEQYTGLKDKNSVEIYEGDIVEWVNGLGEKHIFEIIWNECRASFQMVEIGQEYPYILQGLSDKMKPYCEVIGNIHENPELLGDKE